MAKTINDKLAQAQLEKEQAEARIKQLIQQQKAQERKDRNHRLCKRGGLVEKLLPDLAKLTDAQFETFVDKTLLSGFAEKVLKQLVPPPSDPTNEPEGGADMVHTEPTDASKPAQTAKPQGVADDSKTRDAARVTG
jgi:hypothetical protein